VMACGHARKEKARGSSCVMGIPLSIQGIEKRTSMCDNCHTKLEDVPCPGDKGPTQHGSLLSV
jgi:hypothetical protein